MKIALLIIALFFIGILHTNDENGEMFAGEEQTGSVAGKIEISAASMTGSSRRSTHHAYGMPSMGSHVNAVSNEFTNTVVCLEGENLKTMVSPTHAHATMDQRDAEFIPHILPIQQGTVVDFINRDNVYHNVFSLSSAKKFNIGRRPTGQAVPIMFDNAGVVEVFCDIHSNMSAFIFVMENGFFTQPNEHGNYSIDHVPEGTYVLKVWHERLGIQKITVKITPNNVTTANMIVE